MITLTLHATGPVGAAEVWERYASAHGHLNVTSDVSDGTRTYWWVHDGQLWWWRSEDPVAEGEQSPYAVDVLRFPRAAVLRGADVRLVAANVGLHAPPGTEVEAVSSTADLAQAMAVAAKDADIAVMAAAPADFTPARTSQTKIKKSADGGLGLR